MKIVLDGGKYTLVFEEDTGKLYALRYGEKWRDCLGDGFILALGQHIVWLVEKNKELVDELDSVYKREEYRKTTENDEVAALLTKLAKLEATLQQIEALLK